VLDGWAASTTASPLPHVLGGDADSLTQAGETRHWQSGPPAVYARWSGENRDGLEVAVARLCFRRASTPQSKNDCRQRRQQTAATVSTVRDQRPCLFASAGPIELQELVARERGRVWKTAAEPVCSNGPHRRKVPLEHFRLIEKCPRWGVSMGPEPPIETTSRWPMGLDGPR